MLKVLTPDQFLLSHLLIIAGLVLVTVGLVQERLLLNIIGMWVFVAGFCLGFMFAFRRLMSK